MKRAISLILALVLCLGLSGCKDSGIELTLDNYDDYLSISAGIACTNKVEGQYVWYGAYSNGNRFVETYLYSSLYGFFESRNLAPNFSYSDVKVTVRYSGTAFIIPIDSTDISRGKQMPFTFEKTYELTAGGEEKDYEKVIYDLPQNYMVGRHDDDDDPIPSERFAFEGKGEVIKISGTAFSS